MNIVPLKERSYTKAFVIGILLNTIYVIVEFTYGISIDSSALIADAGHNAGDVLCLVLAWVAIYLAKLHPFGNYTYGLRKTTILAATVNGVLIVVAALLILREAIKRMNDPVNLSGDVIMIIAGIGIFVNTFTALLFVKGQNTDLNIKGTFLHMAADASVSAGVLAGGWLIKQFQLLWIDPALSFIIVAVILWSAVRLLVDSFKLSVDAVPGHINMDQVKTYLQELDGVEDVHELHIWALSTTEYALTAHLVIPNGYDDDSLENIRQTLRNDFNIEHSTIQIENCLVNSEDTLQVIS